LYIIHGNYTKKGEPAESIGIFSTAFAHYFLGAGILIIGQRTKNVYEFWAGLIVIMIAIPLSLLSLGMPDNTLGNLFVVISSLFAISTWAYVLLRIVWIHMKKITKITLI